MKKTKVIRTQRIKTLKILDLITWLGPIAVGGIFLLCMAVPISLSFKESFFDGFVLVIMTLFGAAILSAPVFLACKVITRTLKKSAIQNATLNILEDFDYYRDKLTGVSPSDISMLTDLEIELKKDIAALILKYMMIGVVTIDNGTISVITPNHPGLSKSDCFLLHALGTGSITPQVSQQWAKMAKLEAVEKGYLIDIRGTDRFGNGQLTGCLTALLKGCLTPIILLAVIVFSSVFLFEKGFGGVIEITGTYLDSMSERMENSLNQMENSLNQMEASLDRMEASLEQMDGSMSEQLENSGEWMEDSMPDLLENSGERMEDSMPEQLEDTQAEDASGRNMTGTLSGDPTEAAQIILGLCFALVFMVGPWIPVLSVIFYIAKVSSGKFYKRSPLGQELAEQIYGMKNFIHDFSDLAHASKEQLILWDDFLIYAVLLEENKSIVNEICSLKHVDINGIYRAAQI